MTLSEDDLSTIVKSKEPYDAALFENWEKFKSYYEKEDITRRLPMSLCRDYAIHLAVGCEDKKLVEDLLVKCRLIEDADLMNDYGHAALHNAAQIGTVEAVSLLVGKNPILVNSASNFGETPVFLAAAYGRTDILKFLASKPDLITRDGKLLPEHRCKMNKQRTPILHIAVQGEHFDTALQLIKMDESLNEVDLEDENGMTCLQLLANMPSAFESGYPLGLLESILYWCLPNIEDDDDNDKVNGTPAHSSHLPRSNNLSIWRSLCELPKMERIWEAKKKHHFASELANKLIENDMSWGKKDDIIVSPKSDVGVEEENDETQSKTQIKTEAPLVLATKHGIIEIVEDIIKKYPQEIFHSNHEGHNILLLAFRYRRKEIFDLVKEMKWAMQWLVGGVDRNGYTLLHHAAVPGNKGTRSGPVLQLQDELKWFSLAKKLTPTHYARYVDKKEKQTAEELFEKKHAEQLEKAQKWIKETSQSCSAVAVLIATVVFAAAYTLPGGSNDKGIPNFLHSPFFVFFTIMDVVSLGSSLTSVVMLLSILSSPFELQDFEHSLPRKLTLGFTLLFISVATTMLAFAATLVLIIQLNNKKWTTTVIYVSAFFPVTIFALMQFPLYAAFMGTLKDCYIKVSNFVSRPIWKKKNHINMA